MALQRRWDAYLGGTACISVLDARYTTLDAHHFPSSIDTLSPTRYILQHMLYTTTSIDILCAVNPVWTAAGSEHSGVSIIHAIQPLLGMAQLRVVNIEIRGQAFSFSEADLACLLQRWGSLRELCLVYDLTTTNDVPDIADVHRLLGRFPDIRILRTPGLAARDVSSTLLSMSAPDAHPNPNVSYLSSSTLITNIPVSPNSIAMTLLAMFPKLRGTWPVVINEEKLWLEVRNEIELMVELMFEIPSPLYATLYFPPVSRAAIPISCT